MKYSVSDEGIQALQGMAQAISNSKDEISSHAQQLKSAGEGPDLGPHADSIVSAAEMIEQAINGASEPLEEIADKLEDVADSYEEIIGNDRIRSSVGMGTTYVSGGSRYSNNPETRFEKEITNQPESYGERAPAMASPYANEWANAFPDSSASSSNWDSLASVPFSGDIEPDFRMTTSEYSEYKKDLNPEQMVKLERLIKSGKIAIEPDDDANPPVRVKVLKR